MRAYDVNKIFYGQAGGVRQGLKFADIRRLPLATPPLAEQRAIADYLDEHTAQTDVLIAKQEELIRLLEERRAAVISRLTILGLDPNVDAATNGIEWLGQTPRQWKRVPFRHVFRESSEVNGPTPVGKMVSVSGYRGVEFKEYDSESRMRTPEMLENYRVIRPGQLAVNTMWLNYSGLGVSAILGHMSPAYRAYDIRIPCIPRYLHYLLRSSTYVTAYTGHLRGIRPNSLQMDRDTLMGWPILLPPIDEQQAISKRLDNETSAIDALVSRAREHISLAKERRSALITAAVTGQFDVRTASRRVA
jgi:restriction endonuclease S subunit